MALKPKTNTPAEGTPTEEGFRPSEISAWVAECRSRLRRITGGEERHRAGLLAEARMRQALDLGGNLQDGIQAALRMYQTYVHEEIIDLSKIANAAPSALPPLTPEALAGIERKLATAATIREILQTWAARDEATGPCALEDSACRSLRRLEYLASRGWLPQPDYRTQTAIHSWRALAKPEAAA
jgi:hypothetical protein